MASRWPNSRWKPNKTNISSPTSLHNAVAEEDLIKLRDLLDQVINATDHNGRTALHNAILKKFDNGSNLLLDRGADPGLKDNHGNTALHYACSVLKENDKIAEKILENYFDVDSKNQEGNVALHYACSKANDKVAEQVLRNGGSVTVRNNDGDTPLHANAKARTKSYGSKRREFISRKEAITLQILAKGANLHAVNKLGNTPLHCAAESGNEGSIQILLDKGASLEEKNANGDTPLHVAVKSSRAEVVVIKVLLENGANVQAKDQNGLTPLHYIVKTTCQSSYRHMINELLIWGGSLLTPCGNGKRKTLLDKIIDSCSLLTKPLVEYIIALKATKSNWKQYAHVETLVPFGNYVLSSRFEHDIEKMKEMKFGDNTLFDVFLKHDNPTFVLNTDLEKAVKDSCFQADFTDLGSLLRATFEKAKIRFKMMVKSHGKLTDKLPNEIVWQILTYLKDEDLENVIIAIKG